MATVVVGNPKPHSRTREAAELVAERLTGSPPAQVIDVVDLGPGLLGWGDPAVAAAKSAVLAERELLVVASPTFKGAYTGLLKLFLDQFGAGELAGVPTVALMLGAGPGHAMTAELVLRPVLTEIGASCPAPGLYLLDSDFRGAALDAWLEQARPRFARVGVIA